MLPALFRLIFYAFFSYFVLKVFRFFTTAGKKTIPNQGSKKKKLSEMMVKDEICQTYLPKDDAIREIKKGQEYFFCSKECQNKFLKTKR